MSSFLAIFKVCLASLYFNGVLTSMSPGEVDLYIDSFDLLLNLARSDLHILRELLKGRKVVEETKPWTGQVQVDEYIADFIRGSRVTKEELLLLQTSEEWTEETVEEIAKNPIQTYRLLHRYAHELPTLLASSQLDPAFASVKTAVISSELKWPNSTDLEFAADKVLQLQLTYGVNSTQVSRGKFPGRDLGAQLDLKHCYEIGEHAIYLDYHSQAVEWLEVALEKSRAGGPDSNQVQPADIQRMLKLAIKAHNNAYKKADGLNTMIFNQRLPLESGGGENPSSKIPKIQRVSRRNSLYEKYGGSRKFKKHTDMHIWGLCMGENYQVPKKDNN